MKETQEAAKNKDKEEKQQKKDITYAIYVSKFVCALLLHIQLEKEVKVAIGLLKYQAMHSPLFYSNWQSFFIAMMKLLGAWLTESINIMLILKESTIKDIVMNLIALGVIAEIDNFYASRLFDFKSYQVL